MANVGYINEAVAKMYGIPYSELTAEQKAILHADSVRRAKLIDEREQGVLHNNIKAFQDEAKMEKVLASIYTQCQKDILADVTETMAKVQKAGGTWSYANQSALTRSRGLFEQITGELSKLGQKEQIAFTQGLSNIYTDQFLRQVYTLGQSIPVKANFNRLNPTLIKKAIDYPWSGAMFSDRLWQDKQTLGNNLRVGLTQSMILGEGIPEITDRIQKGIDTTRSNAERVARSETKRVTYVAHDAVYEDTGVKELEYRCANGGDERTCKLCRADNGKKYKRGEEPTLPRHPNCRCVYIPVVSDTFGENGLNELTGSVRGAENYDKWKAEQERKLKKEAIVTPEEKAYQDTMDKINKEYSAKQTEIRTMESNFADIEKEYKQYSAVRRGLQTPEEAGFESMAMFKLTDNRLYTEQQALKAKIVEATKDLRDLERDSAYLTEVGVKRVGSLDSYRAIRTSLRKNSTFDYDTYADELLEMVERMDDDSLVIHKKLAGIVEGNWYNNYEGASGAHYSPYKKRVHMKMSANSHEKALGNGLEGSWQTKYHEEGHQLDHLLGSIDEFTKTGTNYVGMGSSRYAFTAPATEYGESFLDGLKEDLLAFVNKAVDYSNSNEGTSYKPLKNFERVTADSRYAFARYINHLTANGTDRKVACQLGILSDALGLFTKDRISPHSYGLWGHDSSYNKDRGKSGATSETWATFCALRTCGSKEEVKIAKELLPTTWANMDKAFKAIAQYLLTHDISY